MASGSSTPRLDDRTFRLFLHDLHHAFLLLHRAFLQLPPTLIPDLEPLPHDLHQLAGFQPCDPQQPDNVDIEISTDTDAEEERFQLAADQPLPHHAPRAKFPSPVRHLPAPEEGHIPLPWNLQTRTPRVDPTNQS